MRREAALDSSASEDLTCASVNMEFVDGVSCPKKKNQVEVVLDSMLNGIEKDIQNKGLRPTRRPKEIKHVKMYFDKNM